jgi:hypothetical protein
MGLIRHVIANTVILVTSIYPYKKNIPRRGWLTDPTETNFAIKSQL